LNTTGTNNTAVGYDALLRNTTGDNNVAIGDSAGWSTTTGSGNVFIGYKAGYYETGSNKLYIDNSNTTTPLVKGDFGTDALTVNGTLGVARTDGVTPSARSLDANAALTVDEIYHSNGTKMLSYSGGSVHLGPTSMIFTDSSVSTSGADVMTSTVGRIQIGNAASDTTNVVGDFFVNGTNVMGSVRGLADGVRATTAMNAAFSAVPTMSGDREFECGMGLGSYGSKLGVATSCGARISDQVTANFGASFLPGGSESYLLGSMPSVALRAGISFKFGKSYASSSANRMSALNDDTWNSYQLSEAQRDASKAQRDASEAQRGVAESQREVDGLRNKVARLESSKVSEVAEMKLMMAGLLGNRVVAMR
jgi:hypothetical protein